MERNMPDSTEKKKTSTEVADKKNDVKDDNKTPSSSSSSTPEKESKSEPKPIKKKDDEKKQIEVHIPEIKQEKIEQKGVLMQNDTMTISLDDMVEYISQRKEMETLREGEKRIPFIILLNSRFVGNVRSNIRKRRILIGLYIFLLLLVVGVICFVIGKSI